MNRLTQDSSGGHQMSLAGDICGEFPCCGTGGPEVGPCTVKSNGPMVTAQPPLGTDRQRRPPDVTSRISVVGSHVGWGGGLWLDKSRNCIN